MNTRTFLTAFAAAALAASPWSMATQTWGVMLMNRIGPTSADLYIANADGTGEKKVFATTTPGMDYNAQFSPNGKQIVFTSERGGRGQSDLYLANIDGTGVRQLTNDPAVDDAATWSPDGTQIAFVSTRGPTHRANIWILNLASGKLTNLTGGSGVQGDPTLPDGFFRPAWSPDGQWIAFSSDRNSAWRGHNYPYGWEHTQALSLYIIHPDGTGFRTVATLSGYCLGEPRWSPDSTRLAFYQTTVEETWGARRPELINSVTSQIYTVNITTGAQTQVTSGNGFKVFPQWLDNTNLAYQIKGGSLEGLYYTSGAAPVNVSVRAPNWAPGGKTLIYQKVGWTTLAPRTPLYSWNWAWNYQFTDVFPSLANDGTLVYTQKVTGSARSNIVIANADGSNVTTVYDTNNSGLDPTLLAEGLAGAFDPAWSPDSQWIAFGLGQWFQQRLTNTAQIMRIRRDGTGLQALTDGSVNQGFPSYSPDGTRIVYRVWTTGSTIGLRILNLTDNTTQVLTNSWDNLPQWSPDGSKILFTRKVDDENYDIFTIHPDGTGLTRLTTLGANDAHATWTRDGKILWSTGQSGFKDEAALYENTFQPYGQTWEMNTDGSNPTLWTDSLWEDSMPLFIPNSLLH
jgi:Tol biopolymer transport system component